jgi:hypothetical protein
LLAGIGRPNRIFLFFPCSIHRAKSRYVQVCSSSLLHPSITFILFICSLCAVVLSFLKECRFSVHLPFPIHPSIHPSSSCINPSIRHQLSLPTHPKNHSNLPESKHHPSESPFVVYSPPPPRSQETSPRPSSSRLVSRTTIPKETSVSVEPSSSPRSHDLR